MLLCRRNGLALVSAVVLGACGPGGDGSPDAGGPADAAADAAGFRDAPSNRDSGTVADAPSAPDAGDIDALIGSDSGTVTYRHTIVIDGSNDFTTADERFATSSVDYDAYLAWDDQYLYLAVQGADIGSTSGTRFWLIYLGGATGTTTGVTYNTQQPGLPFSAGYHVRWKADNSFTDALSYNGASWVDAGWDFTDDIFQTGDFVELRIPLADLGSPSTLAVGMALINEAGGVEASYAAVPSGSFTDGYDPDWGRYFELDLDGTTVPNGHAPLP